MQDKVPLYKRTQTHL